MADMTTYIIEKLSEAFIDKHQDKVHWSYIFHYQNLSEEFKLKHRDRLR